MKKNLSLKYILMITFFPLILFLVAGLFINNYIMMKNDIDRLVNSKLSKISTSLSITLNGAIDNAIKNYLRGYSESIENLAERYYNLLAKNRYVSRRQTITRLLEKIQNDKASIKHNVFIINVKDYPKNYKFILKPHFEISEKRMKKLIKYSAINLQGYYELKINNQKSNKTPKTQSMYFGYSSVWKWLIFVNSSKNNVRELINIQNLKHELNAIKIGYSGYVGIINSKGVLVIHPSQQDENVLDQQDLKGRYIYREIINKKNGRLSYYWDYGKGLEKNIMYFRHLKEIGFTVFIASPLSDHYETLYTTRNIVIITLVIFTLIIIPVINGLSSIIVRPFNHLINIFEDITRNLEFKKVDLKGNKEVVELSRYYNVMMDEIDNYSKRLEESIDKEKETNEELESAYEEVQASYEELEATQEELEQVNLELGISLSKAEEASKMKSEFLAILSHELRTPLTGMLGFSEILLKNPDLNPKHKKYVDFIHRAGNRLLSVISDLLEISSIEAGKLKINYQAIKVKEIVEDIRILLDEKVKSQGIEFNYNLNGVDEIVTDPARLRQILFNLIGNAIKFTEKGEVRLEVWKKKDNYIFEVIDTGIGIEKADLEKIFDMFKQVEGAYKRYYGGVGLGLAICKKLVQALNGQIWVESVFGKGSKFIFSIPVTSLQKQSEMQSKKESKNLDAKYNPVRLLYAEDDLINNELLKSILDTKTNIEYKNFYNGEELIAEFKKSKNWDLIIVDIQMPFMDGITLLNNIRKIDRKIPVIALTAFASAQDRIKYRDLGFTDYISKPIDTKTFIEKIYKKVK